MPDRPAEMKSIWYLVGVMLMVMGALVVAAGILDLAAPPARLPMLAHLRANLWWGALMVVAGAAFFFTQRRARP